MSDIDPRSLDLPTLASIAGGAANDYVLQRLKAAGFAGIRVSHGYVVQQLVDANPTVGEIAARLSITQQAVSKAVADLETSGIVERHSDPVDSRVRRVALTPRGEALIEATRSARRALETSVADRVGDLDVTKRALVALLEETGTLDAVRQRQVKPSP